MNSRCWGLLLMAVLAACQVEPEAARGKVLEQHEWETPQGRQVTLMLEVVEGPGKGERFRAVLREQDDDGGPGYVVTPGVGGSVAVYARRRADGLHRFELLPPSGFSWSWWLIPAGLLALWGLLKVRQLVRRRRRRALKRQPAVAGRRR